MGFAIHGHHNILFETCYNYDEREEAIKRTKPPNEQKIRLRLFKLLSEEAISELPKRLVEACRAWAEAEKTWVGADRARDEACNTQVGTHKAWTKANKARDKAYQVWIEADKVKVEAYSAWDEADRKVWHDKWCGCKEWNGMEIVFK